MNATADQLPSRGHMIKRLNNFILASLKKIRLRSVGAIFLGGFAGISFNSTILPTVISSLGFMDEFSARWELGGYAVYSFMFWAVGAWAARKTENPIVGAAILGLVGIASGVVLTIAAFGTEAQLLLAGGGGGLIYGGIGGMLIANSLREPAEPA